MVGVKLKHLSPSGHFPSGNPRFYYRPKGQKGKPMPDLPTDHPKFIAKYTELSGTVPRQSPKTGSLAIAVMAYKKSDHWLTELSENTRRVRLPIMDEIQDKTFRFSIENLTTPIIKKQIKEGKKSNPRIRKQVWRAMCKFWKDEYNWETDPTDAIETIKTKKTRGHIPWTRDEVDRYRAYWAIGTSQRTAFELLLWTGARIGDVCMLTWQSIKDDGWIEFTQIKTGDDVFIPFNVALPDFAYNNENIQHDLDQLKQALHSINERHVSIVTTSYGANRSVKGASSWFAKSAREAGIGKRSAHGLRKARALELVYAKATHHEIGAWTGHKSLKEIERYTGEYRKKQLLTSSKEEQKVPTDINNVQLFTNKEAKSNG